MWKTPEEIAWSGYFPLSFVFLPGKLLFKTSKTPVGLPLLPAKTPHPGTLLFY